MLTVEEAQKLLLTMAPGPRRETVPLHQGRGLPLAVKVSTSLDLPPFDRAAVDGYALAASETRKAAVTSPVWFRRRGMVPAGSVPDFTLGPGEAVEILTGAMLPPGADVVIRQEEALVKGEEVGVLHPLSPGQNVVFRGSDLRKGEMLGEEGMVLTPGRLSLLAAAGLTEVAVFAPVEVAVFVTGSELVPAGSAAFSATSGFPAGKIPGSNLLLLENLVMSWGGKVVLAQTLPDEAERIAEALSGAAGYVGVILTSGGVGGGRYDLVPKAVELAGGRLLFHGVAMRPGQVSLGAQLGNSLVIGLSGSPMAAWVGAEVLARPVIMRSSGRAATARLRVKARLLEEVAAAPGGWRFVTCHLFYEEGAWLVQPLHGVGPGTVRNLAVVNAFFSLPPGRGVVPAGEEVWVEVFAEQFGGGG